MTKTINNKQYHLMHLFHSENHTLKFSEKGSVNFKESRFPLVDLLGFEKFTFVVRGLKHAKGITIQASYDIDRPNSEDEWEDFKEITEDGIYHHEGYVHYIRAFPLMKPTGKVTVTMVARG